MASRLHWTMRGEMGGGVREEPNKKREPGPRGQETGVAKMAELHGDLARGREAEAQTLRGEGLG